MVGSPSPAHRTGTWRLRRPLEIETARRLEGLRHVARDPVRRAGPHRLRRHRASGLLADRAGDRLPRQLRRHGGVGDHLRRRAQSGHGVGRPGGGRPSAGDRGRRRQPHREVGLLGARCPQGGGRRDPLRHAGQRALDRGALPSLLGHCRRDGPSDPDLQRPRRGPARIFPSKRSGAWRRSRVSSGSRSPPRTSPRSRSWPRRGPRVSSSSPAATRPRSRSSGSGPRA